VKRKLRGLKGRDIQLDFSLYRADVPIRGLPDMKLSVVHLCPEQAEKAIMFVHGFAGCAETWEHQVNHFSHRYRVIAPDLRGHGARGERTIAVLGAILPELKRRGFRVVTLSELWLGSDQEKSPRSGFHGGSLWN
jgi:pimeloyl-ACP methyl ester carboxylesterase